jgi:hypothetical protein
MIDKNATNNKIDQKATNSKIDILFKAIDSCAKMVNRRNIDENC